MIHRQFEPTLGSAKVLKKQLQQLRLHMTVPWRLYRGASASPGDSGDNGALTETPCCAAPYRHFSPL